MGECGIEAQRGPRQLKSPSDEESEREKSSFQLQECSKTLSFPLVSSSPPVLYFKLTAGIRERGL